MPYVHVFNSNAAELWHHPDESVARWWRVRLTNRVRWLALDHGHHRFRIVDDADNVLAEGPAAIEITEEAVV